MKVEIHTPRVYVEHWDIPSLDADAADAAIIATVRGVGGRQARRLEHRTVDTGSAFVYSRSITDDLAARGRELTAARERAERAVRDFAVAQCDNGASERQVAAALGVDRNTVRAWRGKAR